MERGLKNNHVDYINLAIGTPDLEPPNEIKELIVDFSNNFSLNYLNTGGRVETRKNIWNLIDGLEDNLNKNQEICMVPGAKYGIYLALKTITNVGDCAVLIEPYWLSYPEICKSLGLNIYSINSQDELELGLSNLIVSSGLLPKVVIINNPNNPTGQIIDEKQLLDIILFCKKHEIWVIIDEVYKDLCFDMNTVSHKNFNQENVIRVGSFSKSLAIPGLRSGYVIGNKRFIKNFELLNQHITTCNNSLTEFIMSRVSLNSFCSYVRECSIVYQDRYNLAKELLKKAGYEVVNSSSSFYLFFDINGKFNNGEVACFEFEKKGVLLTPGISYGELSKNKVRMCLTKPKMDLEEAIRRL
jgi:aspartate aminotransferase